jgi:predicted ester cyclase
MKLRVKTGLIALAILLANGTMAQNKLNTQKSTDMENKETLKKLYAEVLNNRQFELLDGIVAADYKNKNQESGPAAFLSDIQVLLTAFPDGKWKVIDMIAEDNRVVVIQEFSGTQKAKFQFIDSTGRTTVTPGIIIYEFKNGQVTGAKPETNQLKFFQDLGLLPADISKLAKQHATGLQVALIDKITIPKAAYTEVIQETDQINLFISGLPGLVRQEAFELEDAEGNKTLVTTAIWDSQEVLAHAREQVQAEFNRINLNPQELFGRLHVKMERSVYQIVSK